MQFWRPRSLTIDHLQAGEPGKPVVNFSPSPKAWEPWAPRSEGRGWMSHFKQRTNPLFLFHPSLDGLGDAHLHWWKWPSSILIFYGNTVQTHPRINVLPALRASLSLVGFTHTIHHFILTCMPRNECVLTFLNPVFSGPNITSIFHMSLIDMDLGFLAILAACSSFLLLYF